jgi:hypothetical protein
MTAPTRYFDHDGLAALALRVQDLLDSLGYCGVRGEHLPWNTMTDLAAAILADGAVFLPDGLPHDCTTSIEINRTLSESNESLRYLWSENRDTIATLRAALDAERRLTVMHHRELRVTRRTCSRCWESDHALALATAKEAGG